MANTHDNTYADMLRHILAEGDSHADRTGVGTTSVFGYQNRYDLADGFPLLTTKRMAWRSIVVELAWFLLGRTDNQWLVDRGVTIWNEWATAEQCAKFGREPGDLGPVYGKQWRNFASKNPCGDYAGSPGVDQIKALCHDLTSNPGSRRLIVTGWNPAQATQVALPPCHTLFQCKVRTVRGLEGSDVDDGVNEATADVRYLDLQLYQRSADCFLGVPFNIASYALLLQLLAHTHNMKPGRFIHTFGDLHIYNNHQAQVQEQLARGPFQAPQLALPGTLRGGGFDGIMQWAYLVGEAALNPQVRFVTPEREVSPYGQPVAICNYQYHPAIKAEVAV
jgi:thymidylate synthase